MESRITVEINFDEQNRPVIQVLARQSDDTRDKILKAFLESLGGDSNWLNISLVQHHDDIQAPFKRYFIRAITPEELKETHRSMGEIIQWRENPQATVGSNS